jgi:hypothetical protein
MTIGIIELCKAGIPRGNINPTLQDKFVTLQISPLQKY